MAGYSTEPRNSRLASNSTSWLHKVRALPMRPIRWGISESTCYRGRQERGALKRDGVNKPEQPGQGADVLTKCTNLGDESADGSEHAGAACARGLVFTHLSPAIGRNYSR